MPITTPIELDVNDDNDDGTTPVLNESFTRWQTNGTTKSIYMHSAHNLSVRDLLTFYVTFPKTNGTFKGMAKSAFKFSKDVTVLNNVGEEIIVPIIGQCNFSLPVGATAEQAMLIRQRMVAMLNDDAVMVPLMEQLMV